MSSEVTAQPDRVLVERETNTIQCIAGDVDDFGEAGQPVGALLDVAESGRLVGIELREAVTGMPGYVELEPVVGGMTRTVDIQVTVWSKPDQGIWRVDVPRRGEGYEITYPSGNQ
jgi:hypothetical protein